RPRENPRDAVREHVAPCARGVPARHALGVGGKDGEVAIPSRGQVSTLHLIYLGGDVGSILPVRRLCVVWAATSGYFTRYDAKRSAHCRRAAAPRAPMPAAKCSRTPSGTRNWA